jgi:iron complex transport system permease protein
VSAVRHPATLSGALALLAGLVALLSMTVGAVAVPLQGLLGWFVGGSLETSHDLVLRNIRLPRVVLGLAVGASLSVCGALMQGLFRNPLASPGLLGMSSGAAFGAAVGIVYAVPEWGLPVGAFLATVVTTAAVLALGTAQGSTDTTALLLAGIAVNAVAAAGTGLMVYLSDDAQLRTLSFFTLGSLGGATWERLGFALPLLLLPVLASLGLTRRMNALMLGEAEAAHLGVDVQRLKWALVLLVAAGVGASVAIAGVIGFVGLAVPHLIRLMVGPDNELVLPGSALLGAALLVAADTAARTVVAPAELPIGILTTLLGGPFFLWLLIRTQRRPA